MHRVPPSTLLEQDDDDYEYGRRLSSGEKMAALASILDALAAVIDAPALKNRLRQFSGMIRW